MEYDSVEDLHDKNEDSVRNGGAESHSPEMNVKDLPSRNPDATVNIVEISTVGTKVGENVRQGDVFGDMDTSGEVNMEASILSDDVIRAGGFGARDDISSFLPVAIDSTDFEASLRDARDYEEPQEEPRRPGLGYTDVADTDE